MSYNMEEIKVLIDEKTLQKRVEELADQIKKDYKGQQVTFICILKGSVFFAVDLARKIDGDVRLEFIRVSSYESGTESSRRN